MYSIRVHFLLRKERNMNLFDLIGPVMVGPSSSHTAGAARIGYVCRNLLGEEVANATILLYGSFLATGKGHGTNLALVAGLLNWREDDLRIPNSFLAAKQAGMRFSFGEARLKNVHPNSVKLQLVGKAGTKLEVIASSVGGGRIRICKMDGLPVDFYAEYPTLVVHNMDTPGHVAKVAKLLSDAQVNIATMQLYRKERGASAAMVLECDQAIPKETLEALRKQDGIQKVAYVNLS